MIQRQNFPTARGVKCLGSCRILKVGICQTKCCTIVFWNTERVFQGGCMTNRESKKTSCFPVILFMKTPSPPIFMTPLYFCQIRPPSQQALMHTQKSCWTPREAIYTLPSPKTVSIPDSVCLNTLGKFLLWGTAPGTIIPWPLLRRYYPRESKKRASPRCREGPLCIQPEHKGSRACSFGLPQESEIGVCGGE